MSVFFTSFSSDSKIPTWNEEVNVILAQKSRLSAIGQIFLAALAMVSLADSAFSVWGQFALWWLIVINAFRLLLSLRLNLNAESGLSPAIWSKFYFVSTWATSALWSAITICCVQAFDVADIRTLHVMIILAGASAAASAGLSPHRPLARAFVLTALLPLIIQLFILGTEKHLVSLGVFSAYLIFLLAQIEIQSRTLLELFSRRDQDRALFDASLEAILIHEEGKVLEVNRSFERMFTMDRENILGQSMMKIVPPEDWGMVTESMRGEKEESFMCRGVRANGEIFPIEVRARFFLYDGRKVRLVCAQDMTQKVRAEHALIEQTRHSQELSEIRERSALDASRLKSQFLANMSHEIRTPMNAIIAITDLLQSEDLSIEGKRFVRTLRESSESLLTLINDILDYSKIEAGRIELEQTDFALSDLVESQVDLMASKAYSKRVNLRCYIDPTLPSVVLGDSGRIAQILLNLIGNAVKFTSEGSVFVRCLKVSGDRQQTCVRFEIQDSGCGISQEVGRRLFHPFVQADASTARKHGGTGLGLSISHSLVEMMNGKIGFDSDAATWTRFWFEISLAVKDPVTLGQARHSHSWADVRCLITKDSLPNEEATVSYLRAWGLSVQEINPSDLPLLKRTPGRQVFFVGTSHVAEIPADCRAETLWMTEGMQPPPAAVSEGFAAALHAQLRIADLFEALVSLLGAEARESLPVLQEKAVDVATEELYEGARVLIAEDNPTNQTVILALLRRFGINGRTVANGEEAVVACRHAEFDLVFMDCQMPEVDGYEATERIRAEEALSRHLKHHPIVALTANAMKEDRDRCMASGMDDFLSKPVRRVQLAEMLRKYLKPSQNQEKAS